MIRWVIQGLVLSLAVTAFNLSAVAQVEKKMPQSWQGVLDVGTAKLRIRLDIKEGDGGKLSCVMTSVDQGGADIPIDSCVIEGGKLTVSTRSAGKITYEGTYSNKGKEIKGTFTQAGRSFEMNMKPAPIEGEKKHLETWVGTMEAGPRTFEFQFRILEDKAKKQMVELDSLTEHIQGLHVEPTFEGDNVTFEVTLTKAIYVGKYNEDKTVIDGHWNQAGGKFPLKLTKIDISNTRDVKPPNRPQNPRQPYPYDSIEVKFQNKKDEITLAGTLTKPKTGGPFPIAILISGSGPQDRDESLMGHKPFLVLADHLTRSGLAVLRYDERGVGKSTGEFQGSNSKDLSRDVEAAIEFLKEREDINSAKIGLIGHSEGGLVAPMLAARRDDIAFIVMLAGPGVTGEEILMNQAELIGRAMGEREVDLAINKRLQKVIFDALRDSTEENPVPAIENKIDDFIETLSEDEKKNDVIVMSKASLDQVTDAWFRFFIFYDPRPALKKVKCPILVLNGEKDLQVDPKLNLPEIRKALEEGGNENFEIHELKSMNHLFQTCKTGSITEYQAIDETFSPIALKLVSEWIHKNIE